MWTCPTCGGANDGQSQFCRKCSLDIILTAPVPDSKRWRWNDYLITALISYLTPVLAFCLNILICGPYFPVREGAGFFIDRGFWLAFCIPGGITFLILWAFRKSPILSRIVWIGLLLGWLYLIVPPFTL